MTFRKNSWVSFFLGSDAVFFWAGAFSSAVDLPFFVLADSSCFCLSSSYLLVASKAFLSCSYWLKRVSELLAGAGAAAGGAVSGIGGLPPKRRGGATAPAPARAATPGPKAGRRPAAGFHN